MKQLILSLIFIFLCTLGGFADIFYVSTNGSHTSPFDTWTKAATNINDACALASAGDTVYVTNGTYQNIYYETKPPALGVFSGVEFPEDYYVTATFNKAGRDPGLAFDKADSAVWNGSSADWYNVQTGLLTFIYRYTNFISTNYAVRVSDYSVSNYTPMAWHFEASTNGTDWDILDTQIDATNWTPSETRWYNIGNTNAYSQYRINVMTNNGGPPMIAEIYFGNSTGIYNQYIYIPDGVTVESINGPEVTIIDLNNNPGGVRGGDLSVFRGFTIKNHGFGQFENSISSACETGTYDNCILVSNLSFYGAIRNATNIVNSTFYKNQTFVAGGINSDQDTLYVSNCVFYENITSAGNLPPVGMVMLDGVRGHITDCNFYNNTNISGWRSAGVGIYRSPSVDVIRCSFSNNVASDGAAITSDNQGVPYGKIFIEDCTFDFNTNWFRRGSVFLVYGTNVIKNCLFVNNRSYQNLYYGGAIVIQEGDTTIENCTFIANRSYYGNDAIYVYGNDDDTLFTGINNIFYSNVITHGYSGSAIYTNTYSRFDSYTVYQIEDGTCTTNDPTFVDNGSDWHVKSLFGTYNDAISAWTTYEIQSDMIDAGNPNSDFSNEPIPNGQRVNMGRYGNTPYASKSWPFPYGVENMNEPIRTLIPGLRTP